MSIQGKQRVQADYSKKVGFDEMNIVAINPSLEQLEELLNIPNMKESQYLGTFQDSTSGAEFPRTTVSIWLQGKISKALFNARYSIIKRERFNKDNTKQQFINEVGSTAWVTDANALKDEKYKWFNTREFWPAFNGEDKLFDFLQKWTNIDTRDPGNQITLDRTKLFKGNYSEVQDLLKSDFGANTVCALATVRVVPNVDVDATLGSFKEYQGVYDEVLPGSYIRYFQDGVTNRPDYVKKYIANLEGEYGAKDFYAELDAQKRPILSIIHDYDPSTNPAVKELQRVAAVANGTVPATNHAEIGANGQPEDDLPF